MQGQLTLNAHLTGCCVYISYVASELQGPALLHVETALSHGMTGWLFMSFLSAIVTRSNENEADL